MPDTPCPAVYWGKEAYFATLLAYGAFSAIVRSGPVSNIWTEDGQASMYYVSRRVVAATARLPLRTSICARSLTNVDVLLSQFPRLGLGVMMYMADREGYFAS
jgi:hypothetical protein